MRPDEALRGSSATEPAATDAEPGATRSARLRSAVRVHRGRVALPLILAVQAAWLATLMAQGWWYQDDIPYAAQALGTPLDWSYLTAPLNDHLSPGLRLVFWFIARMGLQYHWVTIVLRVVVQGAITLLLALLLRRLTSRRRLADAITALFAFSPLLLGQFWFVYAASVLPTQLLGLVGFHAYLAYQRGRGLRWAAVAGVSFGLAATFLELGALNLALLIVVVIGFRYTGSLRTRLARVGREWPGWLLTVGPVVAFALVYLLGGYGRSAGSVRFGDLVTSLRTSWTDTVAPMAFGGPLRWVLPQGGYFGLTDPTRLVVVAAQVVFFALVIAAVYRGGLRALGACVLPLLATAVVYGIVAVGRFATFGSLYAHSITYANDIAIPFAVAAVLAADAPGRRRDDVRRPRPRTVVAVHRATAILLVAAFAAAAGTSGVAFTRHWHHNPARAYFSTLRAQLATRPGVRLYDTSPPQRVLPFIEPFRHLSDLVPLLGRTADFSPDGANPQVVDATGRIRPAVFVPATQVRIPQASFCGFLLRGNASRVARLDHPVQANEYFLRLEYFQQHPTVAYVTIIDTQGHVHRPTTGERVVLDGNLDSVYLRFDYMKPAAVSIRTTTPDANVCLTTMDVGSPFPEAGK